MNIAVASALPAATTPRDGARIVLPGQTPQGGHILSVLLKRSYDIVAFGTCTRAGQDLPLNPGDQFWDSPMNSSVKLESDFVPFKLQTDVVVVGQVHAPGGQPTESCMASFQIGAIRKTLQVTGSRAAQYGGAGRPPDFSDPTPFTAMPLRYERAYGGIDVKTHLDAPYPYPRNPLGRGFVLANKAEAVDGLLLPNFEDPDRLLTPESLCVVDFARWPELPQPVGLGWFPKAWQPRAALAGVMPGDKAVEAELRQAYATLVPAAQRADYLKHRIPDMDFAFFNGASAGLALPYLAGGAVVRTENLHPRGRLDFQLPTDQPRIGLDIGFGVKVPEVVLHSVQIRLDDGQVDQVWRAAVPYPGRDWLPQMTKMTVLVR
jgi:hypothetical protein